MSRFFVGRPIVAMVIAILMVIVGGVAMFALPIAQYPNIVPPQIQVQSTYTGADAISVEQSVATPIEQQMSSVANMLYMQSTNANDGSFNLTVTFDVESNIDIDQVNTQNKAAVAQALLPPDVINFGPYDYAMRIWVRPDKLAQLGFTVSDLAAAIQAQNNVNPSGRLGAPPGPSDQQFTYTVRAQGKLIQAEEFGDVVLRLNPDGSTVRLKDVARIELGSLNYTQIARYSGKPANIIAVFQTPGSNALAVAQGVKAAMAELKTRFPSDVDYAVSLDTTLPVTEGIREIVITLLETTLLVVFVVFIFLQSWRATLIPLIAVPVSLIGTFMVFPALGFTINTLSLFGLVLAIGLVVDDAIVVVEAVERHIEEGKSPKDATLAAMKEVTAPVVSVAVILASVFIPMGFMSGISGRLNKQFALTIAVSVLFSAFNALTLSPALSALMLRPRTESKGLLTRLFGGFNRLFDRVRDRYVGISGSLIRKSVIGLTILGGFFVVSAFMGQRLPSGFLTDEDQGFLFLNVQLPDGASLVRTEEV